MARSFLGLPRPIHFFYIFGVALAEPDASTLFVLISNRGYLAVLE